MTQTLTDAWRLLLTARPEWVAVALVLYCLAWLASSGRWRLIVGALGGRLGWPWACLATIAGVAVNNLTPTGRLGGEACRIALTRLKGELSLSRGALATVCDRGTDIPLITLIFLLALPALPSLAGGYLRAAAITVALVVVALLVFGRSIRQLARTWMTGWQREGVRIGWRTVASGLGFSAAVWIEDILRLMAVGRAFDMPLSVSQGAALVVVGVAGGFVPTIGGLGAVEGALVATLVLFGATTETAIAITALERLISYGCSTSLGGIVVLLSGGRRLWAGPGAGRV